MPKFIDLPDLVDQPEIGRRLGVERETVYRWRKRHGDFPKPVVIISGRPLWRWAEVEGWSDARD